MAKSALCIKDEAMNKIEGQLTGKGLRFGLIVSRFNSFITESLLNGATDVLLRHGVSSSDLQVIWVPGSYEIPLAAKKLAQTNTVDAIVALGAIIRGSTSHYELVCDALSKGISQVALETGIPVGFGVLTTNTIEQAIERAGTKAGNKGAESALAALEMANLLQQIERSAR